VVFDTSSALNSCSQLRDRPGGACSAVCVPISFMGRSLGVLHTTGPDARPLGSDDVARLSTLASQAGARIGTVRAFEKTQLQASTDGLTGLSNRRTVQSQARELLRDGRSFALVIADLDRFKALNDTHGHEAGDRALRLFAQVTEQAIRDDDLLGRWGGEEFVLVLTDLDRFGALSLLERLRARLAAAHPGETARFTASFGVADSTQAGTLDEIVKIADNGLYAAKASGRDRAKIGEPPAPLANGADAESESPAEPAEKPPSEPGSRRQRGRSTPSLHRAALEEEPPASGVQIR
jgi:diguanylate cyclase (GGDEF)-like protein